jgi:DNA-binding CsgD family transcriptional regulator/PAS domain-containing protein
MDREQRAHRLIDGIYRAAVEPEAWQEFVQELSAAYEGAAVLLATVLPGEARRRFHAGLQDEHASQFLDQTIQGLPWSSHFASRFLGRFGCIREVFPKLELRETGFYRDWMAPQMLAPEWHIGTTLSLDGDIPVGGLMVFRQAAAGPFTSADLEFGDLLVSHLSRALEIHCKLSGIQRERLALAEAMDRLPTGVILLDADRQPVVRNDAADRILALDDGFRIEPSGPCASCARDNAAFQSLLADALEPPRGQQLAAAGFVMISRPSGRRSLPVMVTPLNAAPPGGSTSNLVVAIFIADPESGRISATEVLETLYSLTHSEAQLVRLLAQGHSLEEAASLRGVSINTARSHLKHAFAKTETSRQGELVRLVLTGVASIRDEPRQ